MKPLQREVTIVTGATDTLEKTVVALENEQNIGSNYFEENVFESKLIFLRAL
ncbi:hypothetical protein ACT7DG_05025 [Bacillus cereus]